MSIHTLDATTLKEKLESKELSSVEIVRALLDRADKVDGLVRSLVHRFDEQALDAAAAADEARARGDTLGPLHGLPVTIKESVATKGHDTTLGIGHRRGRPAREDAVIVKLLRQAGAIVIGKTNVPQLLLFHETENPIWGRTNNPWNLARVPGGSSGGEAAALAAGISVMGVGTDIGGSIRVPAVFTGTAGLKPTVDRWSNLGCSTALMGQEVIRGQCGPMARTSRDVALMFSAVDPLAQARLDPSSAPVPSRRVEDVDLSKLTVGWFFDDGYLPAAVSLRRTVELAVNALRDAGANVMPFTPPLAPDIIEAYFGALSSDGGVTIDEQLDGEPLVPQLEELRRIAKMSGPVRKAAALAMGLKRERRVKAILEAVHAKPVDAYWKLTARRTQLRMKVFEAWKAAGVDLVICPAHATPALGHGHSGDFTVGGSYSMRYNYVNFPAGAVPISRVQSGETARAHPQDRIERKAALVESESAGLPLGVQVVGRPYYEAEVLAAMIALEERLRESDTFPATPVDP